MPKAIITADLHIHEWTNYPAVQHTRKYWCLEAFRRMCQYAWNNKIQYMIVLGDTFHTYGKIDVEAFHEITKEIKKWHGKIEFIFLLGNHELAIKSDMNTNIIRHLPEKIMPVWYPISSYIEDSEVCLHYLPYYPDKDRYLEKLQAVKENICNILGEKNIFLSHIAVEEFLPAPSNSLNSWTISKDELPRVPLIFLGHYHNHQVFENIHYVGAPIQHTVGEDKEKGFYVLNFDTLKFKFVKLDLPRIRKMFISAEDNIGQLAAHPKQDTVIAIVDSNKMKQKVLEIRPSAIVLVQKEELVAEKRLDISGNSSLEEVLRQYLQYCNTEDIDYSMKIVKEIIGG